MLLEFLELIWDFHVFSNISPLLLLCTFSAHAKVVARDAKKMTNTQDARIGFVSCKSGMFELFLVEKMRRFSTDEK